MRIFPRISRFFTNVCANFTLGTTLSLAITVASCVGVLTCTRVILAQSGYQKVREIERRAILGVFTKDVEHDGHVDVEVTLVVHDSPAHAGGIRTRDLIIEFDGAKVTSTQHLRELVRSRKPGDKVIVITKIGGAEEHRVEVVLGEAKE